MPKNPDGSGSDPIYSKEVMPELDPADCGTSKQYRRHLRRGENCARCRNADSHRRWIKKMRGGR